MTSLQDILNIYDAFPSSSKVFGAAIRDILRGEVPSELSIVIPFSGIPFIQNTLGEILVRSENASISTCDKVNSYTAVINGINIDFVFSNNIYTKTWPREFDADVNLLYTDSFRNLCSCGDSINVMPNNLKATLPGIMQNIFAKKCVFEKGVSEKCIEKMESKGWKFSFTDTYSIKQPESKSPAFFIDTENNLIIPSNLPPTSKAIKDLLKQFEFIRGETGDWFTYRLRLTWLDFGKVNKQTFLENVKSLLKNEGFVELPNSPFVGGPKVEDPAPSLKYSYGYDIFYVPVEDKIAPTLLNELIPGLPYMDKNGLAWATYEMPPIHKRNFGRYDIVNKLRDAGYTPLVSLQE